jgi:protocatechuate 3,4-dioxygenase beta subunit
VTLGALLAAGGAGWLLWDAGAQERSSAVSDRQGPLLTGRVSARGAGDAPADEGEFAVTGIVLDEVSKPAAGIRVEARLLAPPKAPGDATPEDTTSTELADLLRASGPNAQPPVAANATTTADGTFALTLKKRGEYELRPAPEPPRLGIARKVTIDLHPHEAVTLRLATGTPLRGRVIDAQDHGVAAFVDASHEFGWQEEETWSAGPVATAFGNGAFTFEAVPEGTVDVRVRVPGRMVVSAQAKLPHPDELVIRIGADAPLLAGVVTDLERRPVAGAQVGVLVAVPQGLAPGLDVEYVATSDAEGRYRIAGPYGGTVTRARAAAAGYLSLDESPPLARWSGLALKTEAESTLDLTLWQGGSLTGTVRERGTGKPLAGARIQVLFAAVDARLTAPEGLEALSDAEGRYTVARLPVGRAVLWVEHPTHYFAPLEALPHASAVTTDLEISSEAVPDPPAALTVFLAREGGKLVKDLELDRGLEVSGRVVDAAGAPVEGAEIRATGRGLDVGWSWDVVPPDPTALARSGPDGRFTAQGLAPRSEWSLHAKKKGFLGEPSPPFPLVAGAPAPEVVLRMHASAAVAGRVVDGSGNPVPDAWINCWYSGSTPLGANDDGAQSRQDGTYRLEGLAPGSVELGVWRHGASAQLTLRDLKSGEVREGIELALGGTRQVLSGVLVDEQGAAVRSKSLWAKPVGSKLNWTAYAYSGRDGTFRFETGAPGKIRIYPEGAPQVELAEVDVPGTDVRVVWKDRPATVVEGLVTDAAGKPVPLCSVTLAYAWGDESRQSDSSTAVNGWFRRHLRGVAPIQVKVQHARDADGHRLNLKDETLNLTEVPTGPLTIALKPGLLVAGHVLDAQGRPVPGVPVGAGEVRETTDEEGAFRLGGLADGSVNLVCSARAPWIAPPPQTVPAGSEDVVFRLKAGLAITGRVIDEEGRPVTDGEVDARWSAVGGDGDSALNASLGREGRFRFDGLPESALVTVTVRFWSERPPRRVAGVRPGTDNLVIDLGAGVTVEGFVVDAHGRPFTQCTVRFGAREDEGDDWEAELQPDGTFRAGGLSPGPVWIGVRRDDGGQGPARVRVEAPATKVRIVMPPTSPIRGRITGAGPDASRFRVWACQSGSTDCVSAQDVAKDGAFTIEGVGTAGTWMVAAHADGDDRYAFAGPFPSGAQDVALELRAGRSIEGTVTKPEGRVAPRSTWIYLRSEGAGVPWTLDARMDEEGRFVFRGLPPGRYSISVTSYGGGSWTASREGIADGTRDVKLVLATEDEGGGGNACG